MTIGTLADLVAIEGMPSLPIVRLLIAADPCFPVVQRGRHGLPYRLDLEIAASYVRENWRDRRCRLVAVAQPAAVAPPEDGQTTWAGLRVGSLADLGAIDGMPSLPSLQRFIADHADFPILQRGRYGVRYVLDLDAATSFVRSNWKDGRRRKGAEECGRQGDEARQHFLPGFDPTDAAGAA